MISHESQILTFDLISRKTDIKVKIVMILKVYLSFDLKTLI